MIYWVVWGGGLTGLDVLGDVVAGLGVPHFSQLNTSSSETGWEYAEMKQNAAFQTMFSFKLYWKKRGKKILMKRKLSNWKLWLDSSIFTVYINYKPLRAATNSYFNYWLIWSLFLSLFIIWSLKCQETVKNIFFTFGPTLARLHGCVAETSWHLNLTLTWPLTSAPPTMLKIQRP